MTASRPVAVELHGGRTLARDPQGAWTLREPVVLGTGMTERPVVANLALAHLRGAYHDVPREISRRRHLKGRHADIADLQEREAFLRALLAELGERV